jgi:hypothetical protein
MLEYAEIRSWPPRPCHGDDGAFSKQLFYLIPGGQVMDTVCTYQPIEDCLSAICAPEVAYGIYRVARAGPVEFAITGLPDRIICNGQLHHV